MCVNNGVKYTWCVCVNNGVKYTWRVCVNNGVNDANYSILPDPDATAIGTEN